MDESVYSELPLGADAVRFLQWLARQHEQGNDWVVIGADAPVCETWVQLGWLNLLEGDKLAMRLTDFGWDALGNLIEAVGDD